MLGTAPLGKVPVGAFTALRRLTLVAEVGSFMIAFNPRFFGRLYTNLSVSTGNFTVSGQDAQIYLVGISRPNVDAIQNGWRTNADGTELFSSVDEPVPDDLDYIQSATVGSAEEDYCEMHLQDLPNPGVDYGHRIGIRFRKRNVAGSIAGNLIVELRQGSTVIHTRTFNNVSTGWNEIEYEIPVSDAANITNYDDLRLRLRATA